MSRIVWFALGVSKRFVYAGLIPYRGIFVWLQFPFPNRFPSHSVPLVPNFCSVRHKGFSISTYPIRLVPVLTAARCFFSAARNTLCSFLYFFQFERMVKNQRTYALDGENSGRQLHLHRSTPKRRSEKKFACKIIIAGVQSILRNGFTIIITIYILNMEI